ncbi:MAG: hydantoinase B/oxoprolinase family protein, partial [Rhizobiales bacterium]|nr:hydantoinase B/oxoprolinase family protein [Hyphomicrobiales bacterium]
MSTPTHDPVTFDIIQNSLQAISDEMFAAMRKTAMSAIIYEVLDMGTGICAADGEIASSGAGIPAFIGVLDKAVKAVLRKHSVAAIHPGDVFATNDPFYGGVTHLNDMVLVMPVFAEGEIVAWTANIAHWNDVGGMVPGSMSTDAVEIYQEGLRVPAIKIIEKGVANQSVMDLLMVNSRLPAFLKGDMWAAIAAVRIGDKRILDLVNKYGKDTVVAGFADVQDYVERAMRQRLAALPDGVWETQDFIDRDPSGGEGMIPVKVKMTKTGDRVIYDFTGSHPCIGSLYNSAFGSTFSAVAAGMKTFFPDLPLNSGFYRPIEVIAPEDTVVNARWPVAVTGFLMPFEKIMNSIYEIWSGIMPQRAIACAFNLEYLLTGGRDRRAPAKPIFMFYDWLPGGWGGRNGRDGCNVTTACFGTGLQSQPVEGQERGSPILTMEYQVLTDSPGPGKWRGG